MISTSVSTKSLLNSKPNLVLFLLGLTFQLISLPSDKAIEFLSGRYCSTAEIISFASLVIIACATCLSNVCFTFSVLVFWA